MKKYKGRDKEVESKNRRRVRIVGSIENNRKLEERR